MKILGKLDEIRRYPVKSMAGEKVDAIYVHETGLNGDRIFAFYDYNSKREGRPYFTGREKRNMLLLRPEIINEPDRTQPYPEDYNPEVNITLPNGDVYAVSSPEIINHIEQLANPRKLSIELDYRKAGIQDSKPVSLMGMSTVEQMASETGIENLDPRRFRENFYINWDEEAFFEDSLTGKSLKIGDDLLIHVVKRTERCPMVCVNPDTAEYDKRVLGSLIKNHNQEAGVYAIIRNPGLIHQGDTIFQV